MGSTPRGRKSATKPAKIESTETAAAVAEAPTSRRGRRTTNTSAAPEAPEALAANTAATGAPARVAEAGAPKPRRRRRSPSAGADTVGIETAAAPASPGESAPGESAPAEPKPKPKRPRISRARKATPPVDASASVAGRTTGAADADAAMADASSADASSADAAYADALASAFLFPALDEDTTPQPDTDEESPSSAVDLPFIVDPPVRPAPAPVAADDWVDLVLESSKPVASFRPPRTPRPSAQPLAKTIPNRGVPKGSARGPAAAPATATSRAALKTASALPAGSAAGRTVSAPAVPVASGTRWWLVAPVFLVLAVVLVMNRPGRRHAPVPSDVLGTWTTAFWLYENQTLEIKPDTVVLTLDEPEEGRYPITQVEARDAGRETAVRISYRLHSGDEKELDFLADKEPTTALRFRAHSGLVWLRP